MSLSKSSTNPETSVDKVNVTREMNAYFFENTDVYLVVAVLALWPFGSPHFCIPVSVSNTNRAKPFAVAANGKLSSRQRC
jgi:hypothetical protein